MTRIASVSVGLALSALHIFPIHRGALNTTSCGYILRWRINTNHLTDSSSKGISLVVLYFVSTHEHTMSFPPSFDNPSTLTTIPPLSTSSSMQHLRSQLRFYRQALSSFASSASTFKVLTSISSPSAKVAPPSKTLYILDSSFNPPTLGHLRIALSAVNSDGHQSASKRLILLLSTQNADKAPKPAAFEQRLVMMEVLAQELLSSLETNNPSRPTTQGVEIKGSSLPISIDIDIALTTHALFAQKALAISSSPEYPQFHSIPQTHLVGYDTLIRILDPRYYNPPTLSSLDSFLSSHRLLVTPRLDASWSDLEEQKAYLHHLGDGGREAEGGKASWVTQGRIEFGEEEISSTKVREAVRKRDEEMLSRLVTKGVKDWILGEGLYLDD